MRLHMGNCIVSGFPITFSSPVGLLAVQRKLSSATLGLLATFLWQLSLSLLHPHLHCTEATWDATQRHTPALSFAGTYLPHHAAVSRAAAGPQVTVDRRRSIAPAAVSCRPRRRAALLSAGKVAAWPAQWAQIGVLQNGHLEGSNGVAT